MINQELINTKVGSACARLGFPITNAYDWQSTGLTEAQILAEIAVMDSEQVITPVDSALRQLEQFYAAQGWSSAQLTEALNMVMQYTLANQSLPAELMANIQTHGQNKAKAKLGQTNFDPLPHKPSEVL
jgi:hypothetical protein